MRKKLLFLTPIVATLVLSGFAFFYSPSAEKVSSQQIRRTVKSDEPQTEYVATRKIIFDRDAKILRFPTAEEVDKLVSDLKRLTDRSTENLKRMPLKNGGEGIDLDGRFGGVMLARSRPDGSSEIKCVFDFEEGARFLGLVEADTTR